MKAWKALAHVREITAALPLQLGHAGEGVERTRFYSEGNDSLSLQLGHAGEGVES